MTEVIHVTKLSIHREPHVSAATLPPAGEVVRFGMYGAYADYYKMAEDARTPHAMTLDYLAAATAACLLGTLAGSLSVRKIDVEGLRAEVEGDIEVEDRVPVLRRIRVAYHFSAPESSRETVERAHSVHKDKCPAHKSVAKAIEVTTELKVDWRS